MYGNIIHAKGVNEALYRGLMLVKEQGVPVESRGMQTLEVPGPVMTVYDKPRERVLFDVVRDANPFFHLMESLWILSGSNHVALPRYFLSSIDRFSDDGRTFHGAYGHRLREAFGFDQLESAISILIEKPDSRQVVLSIWDVNGDLGVDTKDMPCNDMIMLKVRDGVLNMTVCNRSNDMIWGAYGANVVQFSMLQEWLAARIGVSVGRYVQQSDSFHVYTGNPFWQKFVAGYKPGWVCSPYEFLMEDPKRVRAYPMVQDNTILGGQQEAWKVQRDCEALDQAARNGVPLLMPEYHSPYFKDVVLPALAAYEHYKLKEYEEAVAALAACYATDWRLAMTSWVRRRQAAAMTKEQA